MLVAVIPLAVIPLAVEQVAVKYLPWKWLLVKRGPLNQLPAKIQKPASWTDR